MDVKYPVGFFKLFKIKLCDMHLKKPNISPKKFSCTTARVVINPNQTNCIHKSHRRTMGKSKPTMNIWKSSKRSLVEATMITVH